MSSSDAPQPQAESESQQDDLSLDDDLSPDDGPSMESRPACADWLEAQIRERAEALGERVRARQLPKAEMRIARPLLRRAFAFEEAPSFELAEGVSLLNALERLLGEGMSERARVDFTWRHFHHLMRRWPITVPCMHRIPIAQAAWVALEMVDVRLDRLDAIFALLQVDEAFAWREIKATKVGHFDNAELEIVRKQGSS